MTYRISAGLILLLMLLAYPAMQARAFENARELTNACRKVDQEVAGKGKQIWIPRAKDALLCWGYMQALQDIVTLADEAGRPHPETLKGNAAVAVIMALQSTYPCTEAERAKRSRNTTGADIQPVESIDGRPPAGSTEGPAAPL